MEKPNIAKMSASVPLKKHPEGKLDFLYTTMLKIRNFELTVEEKFKAGEIPGFAHRYIGEEAVAIGVMAKTHKDCIESTHQRYRTARLRIRHARHHL